MLLVKTATILEPGLTFIRHPGCPDTLGTGKMKATDGLAKAKASCGVNGAGMKHEITILNEAGWCRLWSITNSMAIALG